MSDDAPVPEQGSARAPGSEREEQIRELLAGIESPPVPDDVRISVMAAITREAQQRRAESGTGQPEGVRRRRVWGPRRIVQISAVAAALVVVGAVAIPAMNSSDSDTTIAAGAPCTVDAHAESDMSVVMRTSGVSYDSANLVDQANSMLKQPSDLCGDRAESVEESYVPADQLWLARAVAPQPGLPQDAAAAPDAEQADPPGSSGSPERASAGTGGPPEVDPGLLAEVEPEVRSCVVAVVPGRRIMAVDVASFDGRPSVVVVAGGPAEVLAVRCAVRPPEVLAQVPMT